MSFTIAIAGKGGTGKTTISAMIVHYLLQKGETPILAIDADPNENLADSLGVNIKDSISTVLSDFLRNRMSIPGGMTKQSFLELKLHQILKEGTGLDMLVMGCPEGAGCYCSANNVMKSYFDDLVRNYRFVVIDNEAGMEHFSRKTATKIDLLIFCSNYSVKGIKTAERLSRIVDELGLNVEERYLLITGAPEELDPGFRAAAEKTGIPVIGHVQHDSYIEKFDVTGQPVSELPEDSMALNDLKDIMDRVLAGKCKAGAV